ncbi:MAG TPA: DinB family protein [Gemmatimonadales bacterium]|nr:DinB family protein [Gemmatimonadales bacterium]
MPDPLLETWQIHNRINLYLLRAVSAPGLSVAPLSGGRSVAQIFAHIHNVRLMWLEAAGTPTPRSVTKLDKDAKLTVATLTKALEASGETVGSLVQSALDAGGRVKGFKPHVHAFVGYLISHESHHRGQATMVLKAAGAPLDKKIAYGLWEWGVR